jgi:hypothetical protein
VSVALVEHTGPWTPDDVEALPDLGDHARFEVHEGGVLVVSPAVCPRTGSGPDNLTYCHLTRRRRRRSRHDRSTSHFPPAATAVNVPASHSRAQIRSGM